MYDIKNYLSKNFKSLNNQKVLRSYIFLTFYSYIFYWLLKYGIGIIDEGAIFFYSSDRFADVLKIIVSFDFIFSNEDLLKLNVRESWIYRNPYSEIYFGNATAPMSLPPLSIIFLTSTAHLTKIFATDYKTIFILLIFVLLVSSVFQILKFKNTFFYSLFIITSYPFLFLIDRGNLMAGIAAIFLFPIFRNFIKNEHLNNLNILYFILACSIRPNYLIFGLLFLTKKNTRENILNLFAIGFSFVSSNILFFIFAKNLFPNYSFSNFRGMVSVYFENPLSFSSWNTSLYGAIVNTYRFLVYHLESNNLKTDLNFFDRLIYSPKLVDLITIVFITLLLISYKNLIKNKMSRISFLIIVCCTTVIITHPIGDYHLTIFVFLFLIINNSNSTRVYSGSLFAISLIILPKVHMNSPNLNYSNLINVGSMLYLFYINFYKYKIKNLM